MADDKGEEAARRKRAELVKGLGLRDHYNRSHTGTGTHRRLEITSGPPQVKPKAKPEDLAADPRKRNVLKKPK